MRMNMYDVKGMATCIFCNVVAFLIAIWVAKKIKLLDLEAYELDEDDAASE